MLWFTFTLTVESQAVVVVVILFVVIVLTSESSQKQSKHMKHAGEQSKQIIHKSRQEVSESPILLNF